MQYHPPQMICGGAKNTEENMNNLIDGQTINSYAMERIKEKAWLNSVDDNKWDGLPIVRKRKSTLTKYLPLPHSTEYTVPTDITKISMEKL